MTFRRTAACLALAGGLVHSAGVLAQAPVVDARELDERLKRIERLFGSDSLFKLFDEVESLGTEVRELRGQLETLSHTVERLEARQRELYLDVDQRLERIETATPTQTAAAAQPPGASPGDATTPTETAQPSQPVTTPATSSTTETPSTGGVDPFAEQQAYQSAFDMLKSGRYEDAAVAFQQFIADFPTGTYADNAQYWLGETFYITRQFDRAVQEFERLMSTHPNSQKLTHAMLKIGYAHDELGNKAEAERVLGLLIERHPQTAAAGLARKRLLIIRQ